MPDLKQALRDFIATSNSGKYADEATLLSKFPELSGYDIQSLRDFVATSNSGKYKTEDEVFSKFPEFSIGAIQEPVNVKKKGLSIGGTNLQDGSDFSQPTFEAPSVLIPQAQQEYIAEQEQKPVKIPVKPPPSDTTPKGFQTYQAPSEEENKGYLGQLLDRFSIGINQAARIVASIPEATYTIFSAPQNAVAWATGLDISTNADKFGKTLGIENPILKQLDEEDKILNERVSAFNKANYEKTGVYENLKDGNYGDAFELLGSGIVESAPVSLAMMYGGATLTASELVAAGTIAFEESSRKQLEEDSPNMPEIEKTIKALAMSSAETVFSSIGTGTIGQVYRDIIKKEGVEAGKVLFKDGLVEMYKSALKKYGAPIGLLGEGIEEAATQITQNLISGRPAFQGAADAFIIGGGSGVAFSAPINIIQAKEQINNIVETNKAKSDINTILKDNPSELYQIFNVSQAEPFTSEQIQITNTNKSRDVLVKNLAKNVKDGVITDEDAKQSVYIFDKAQQVSNAVKKLDVNNDEKTQIANLLSKRNNLKTEIETQDDALVVKQKQEVNNINQQISDIILNSKPVSQTIIPEEISSLEDDEVKVFAVETLEEIPEQFRDRAELSTLTEVETREKIFGLPIGKKGSKLVGGGYTYTLTGKEAKDYAIQIQTAGQVPVLTEAGVSQEVEQGEPQAEPQGVAQEGVQEEVTVQAPEITRESIRLLTDEEVNPLYDEIPMNLLPIAENVSKQDAVFEAYFKSKKKNTNPELVKAVETLLGKAQVVSLQTQTEEQQLARMEEMFAEKEIPEAPPVSQGTSVTNKSALDQVKSNLKDTNKISIVDSAEKIITTLKSVLPNFDIVIHDNDDSYTSSMGSINAPTESAGNFSYVKMPDGSYVGRIDINLNKANQRTVAHEVAHGVMLKAFGENIETFKTFKNRIASVLNDSSNKELSDFASQYAENDSYEEYLAELTAKLEQQEGKLSASTLQKIAAIINELVSNITNGTFTPFQDIKDTKDAVEFFKNISESMRKGEAIKPSVVAAKKSISKDTKADRKSKAQIIGNNAQLSATVKFNLDVAKEMAKNKMSPLDIRIQTGWEKGFEGRWRYEIPDGEFKDLDIDDLKRETSEDGTVVRVAKLSDVFNAPDLYQAYPEIKNTKTVFKDLPPFELGSYNIYTNTITVNKDLYKNNKPEANLTMLHEMQHYIQNKEFFEGGSNPSYAPIMMNFVVEDFKNKVNEQLKKYNNIKKFFSDDNNAIKNAKELYKFTKERYSKINELLLHKDEKSIKNSYKDIGRRFNISDLPTENILENRKADGFNLYIRVAGEVEARNVEYRNKLTPEQRRKTLLSDTENIDREDQILFENKELLFSEDVDNMNQKYPVSKSQLTDANKISKLIKDARVQGFSESVIETFLQRKGLNAEQISAAMGKVIPTAGRVDLSEEMLPGYTKLMNKIDLLFSIEEPFKELVRMLKNSNEYINATDIQREKLVRDLRKKFRLKEKSAPLVQKIIGAIKDVAKITMSEKDLLKKQIKDLARGAKDAKKLWRQVSGNLTKEIKELASSGKITAKQMASVLRKFSSVDMFNEKSIDKFVDYMVKVFGDAEYVEKMTTALAQIKNAKTNIKTKIGVAQDLFEPLNQLLSINPTLVPLNQLEKYLGILKDFSERKAVLSIDDRVKVLKQVNEILDEINNELSAVDVLADRFNNYDKQVFNEEGGIDYAATIKKMIDNGLISTDEADLMKKYKSEILPQVEATPLTEEEIAEQKKEQIKILKSLKIDNKEFPLPSLDEKEDALNLAKLIKELSVEDLMNISLTDLKNIIKVIDNINNGYLPHYAKISIEKLNAIKEGKVLSNAIEKGNPLSFSKLYSRLKNKFTEKGVIDELIRANPLYYIDNVFGDFKTRDIFNSLFEKSAQALSIFNSELKRIEQKIEAAQNKVLASFNQNSENYLMSKFRMTAYMLQREYESNIGKKGVKYTVSQYLEETIKHIATNKSIFKEADAKKLQKILKEVESYIVDGKIDLDKFYKTFNSAEKNAINVMTEINKSLGETAAYTAAVIRGDKVELMDNYFHHNVLHEQNPMDATSAPEFSSSYSSSMRPSTKAKSLIERTDKLTPLNFDLFTSTYKGAKFVLLDYNLTSPIRTAKRTLIQAKKNLQKVADKKARDEAKKTGVTDENKLSKITGVIPKQQTDINNAIENAYEEALQNVLTNAIVQDGLSNATIDFIQKQGYRATLAGTTRFQAELLSNITNALLINPSGFIEGIKHAKLIASANGYQFMKNAKAKQLFRLYASDALSGKMVDPQILKQTSGIKGSVSKGALQNRTLQIYNLTLKKYVQNPVEYIADTMLTTPDKVVSMPLWFGSFMNEFKKITGEEVNQDMMINNDLDYMQKYADAIEQSTRKADQESVYSGASNNEFMGILKGKIKPNQGFTQKAWNNFNSYMTNFMNFDYAAARSAVYNLFNEGYMTKKKAAAVLAGLTTRSVIYQVMVANMGAGVVGAALGLAFDWEDEEEVDEKSFFQKLGRGLANVLVGYTVGRNFGNAVRGMINFGVEQINEEYLDFLRNGEYDFYKDNIAYSYLNFNERGDIDIPKVALNMAGAYTPALSTAVLIGKNFGAITSRVMGEGSTKKEPEAIRREDMTVNYKIPLEVAGNLGLIPIYKDVKKAVNDEIYKDLRKAANTSSSSITSTEDYEKIKDLRQLKESTTDEDELRIINKKIIQVKGTKEQKKVIEESNKRKKERKDRLLYDSENRVRYDNESEMKRYNQSLYNERFGVGSDWYEKTKYEQSVESKLSKINRKREDKEYEYTTPPKKK